MIKRYDNWLKEASDGEYVKYADMEQLITELKATYAVSRHVLTQAKDVYGIEQAVRYGLATKLVDLLMDRLRMTVISDWATDTCTYSFSLRVFDLPGYKEGER